MAPTTLSPIIAIIPESADTITIDKNLTPTVATIPKGGDAETGITDCAARDGNLWVLYDVAGVDELSNPIITSVIRKFNPATGEQIGDDIVPFKRVGELNAVVTVGDRDAVKSLMEIDCGRLLSVDRNSREVIAIKVEELADNLIPVNPDDEPVEQSVTALTSSGPTATATVAAHGYSTGDRIGISGAIPVEYNGARLVTVIDANTFEYTFPGGISPATGTITAIKVVSDGSIGEVVKRYKLVVNPLDACTNSDATRLWYIVGGTIKIYDLTEDAFIRDLVSVSTVCT